MEKQNLTEDQKEETKKAGMEFLKIVVNGVIKFISIFFAILLGGN